MRKCRLPLDTQQKLICQFIDGVNVRDAATNAKVNKNTASSYFGRLRELIYSKDSTPGIVQIDSPELNSMYTQVIKCSRYFSKGKLYGLAIGENKLKAFLFPDQFTAAKKTDSNSQNNPDYLVYQDSRGGVQCSNLAEDSSVSKVVRFKDCEARQCAMKKTHGDDTFCELFAQMNKRCCGIPRQHFHLYLKELEWKFNNPDRSWQINQLTRWAVDEMG